MRRIYDGFGNNLAPYVEGLEKENFDLKAKVKELEQKVNSATEQRSKRK